MQPTLSPFWTMGRRIWLILSGIILGIGLGLFINGYWLIDFFPAESKRLLLFTILASLLGSAGYSLLIGWMRAHFSALSVLQRLSLTSLSLLIGVFLFFSGTDQWNSPSRYVTFFLPTHRLQVSVFPAHASTEAAVLWFNTSLGDVSYDTITYRGWKRETDQLVLQDPSDNAFYWVGKTGERVQLVFRGSASDGGKVIVSWDGQEETLDLSPGKFTYVHSFSVPFSASRALVLSLGIFNFAFLSLALSLLVWEKRATLVQTIGHSVAGAANRLDALDRVLLPSLVVLTLLLRVFNLASVFPAIDEYYHLIAARQIVQGLPLSAVYQRSLWIVTLPVSLALRVFGHQLWAARLVGVVFNILAIFPLYLLTRKINRPIAVLSSLLYATSPWIIAFARVVREYAYYPFYFYWIIYWMVLFIEEVPTNFILLRDWKVLLRPKMGVLALGLILPPVYALYIDPLSTFRIILIAYIVFGIFVLLKFDWRDRINLFVLVLVSSGILAGGYMSFKQQEELVSSYPQLNPFPIGYFFPNPQQQWYFNRLTIILGIGFLGAVFLSFLIRRINFIPLFFLALYGSFLGFFIFFSKTFFHTRHLSTTQLWYIVLVAIGLYVVWRLIYKLLPLKGNLVRVLLTVFLVLSVSNVQQILLPLVSNNPDMPISEDYHHDLSLVHAFMLNHVREGDVLISTVYGLYASWEGEPRFQTVYRVTIHTPKEDIFSIVDQHPSGWIVIDQIRLQLASMTTRDFSGNDQIEFIGLFGDQYVWHWQHSLE